MKVWETARPVIIRQMQIRPERLPDWEPMLCWLPEQCGFKGGIARKILKVVLGCNGSQGYFRAEKEKSGDIDLLVCAWDKSPELRKTIRGMYAGTDVCGQVIEPKDIEVCADLKDFFRTRDITMNECVVLRTDEKSWFLLYTQEAGEDAPQGLIRPSVHCLHTGYSQVWQFNEQRNAVVTSTALTRTIIRYLKGHGNTYALDSDTLDYHSRHLLPMVDVWRILKPFHADDNEYLRACDHLQGMGWLVPGTNPNRLWGQLLYALNEDMARYGRRFKLVEPDVEAIEDWIDYKAERYRQWSRDRVLRSQAGEQVEPDHQADVYLPQSLAHQMAQLQEL